MASAAFYEPPGFVNVKGSTFNQNGVVAMMQLDEMIMELYQLPARELAEISNRKNGHIDHIAFDVDGIDKVFEEQPVLLTYWKNGCKYFNITGPDNERLEFNQIL